MLTVLGFVCFVAAAIWFVITRSWPMALLSAGLALWALDQAGPVRIG